METAWLEAQQGLPFKAQPMTLYGYAVDCADALNVTDPTVLAACRSTQLRAGCDIHRPRACVLALGQTAAAPGAGAR